jgi:3-phenylpropionate/trans-cinnamate dioxygenase ferredoxin reductase subunit
MNKYEYLIIGGGETADSAVRGIREIDKKGTIAILAEEKDPPYSRPPLSKSLWKGKPLDKIWRNTKDLGVDLFLNTTAKTLEIKNKKILTDKGEDFSYQKLLLAHGGTPRKLPLTNTEINYYRYLEDYRRLHAGVDQFSSFGVIGGGFIGSEIASMLSDQGKKVSMVYKEEGISARVLPKNLSDFVSDYYQQKGITLFPGTSIENVEPRGKNWTLRIKDDFGNEKLVFIDYVIAGLGIIPNIQIAEQAGIEVSNGINVNEYCETNQPGIFSAGDIANYFDPVLEIRRRVEHEDNAIAMGLVAGKNMAGEPHPYNYLPFFYSDMFDLGYEAVGELDSRLDIFSDWQETFKKGVLYYSKNGFLRGVLLWNVWGKIDAARELIKQKGPYSEKDLTGKII